jgi:tRNA(Ile)-lysidine synthase
MSGNGQNGALPGSAPLPGKADPRAPCLTDPEFARAMARLGPFEPAPALALAVSGGADSLALALLAECWARAQGGRVTALTVDHRLRADSASEAEAVGEILRRRGIAHQILVWHGPYPLHDLQAEARTARYRLLGDWCRRQGVLHLLTAHHQDDQAETLLLRLGRGSGLAGLAGMAPVVEDGHWRLLRPLLDIPAARLRATLQGFGQDWIEDPSNRNPVFARARLRAQGAVLAAAGLSAPRLAETCRHLARARTALERVTERVLAEAALLHPAGFALVDPAPLAAAEAEIGLRALAALIATIGAEAYPPRFERLERLAERIFAGALAGGRTLGGCRIVPYRGRVLLLRELAATSPPVEIPAEGEVLWDNRFLAWRQAGASTLPGLSIGALGVEGAATMRAIAPKAIVGGGVAHHLPGIVRPSLPALWQDGSLLAVPHIGWRRPGSDPGVEVRLRPARPLSGSGFTVV